MNRLTRRSENSIATRRALEAELAAIRARGYATNLGEGDAAVAGVGAATVDSCGAPLVAIAVGAPISRLDRGAMPALGARVRRAVDGLGRLLVAEGLSGDGPVAEAAGGGLAAP